MTDDLHPPSSSWRGRALVVAAAALWGTTGTAQAFAPAGTPSAAVGAMRLIIGGLALLAFALARRTLPAPGPWPVVATFLAGAGVAAYQLFFFAAVARTGVALGSLVTVGSAPILAGALALLIRREMPGWRWVAATALAVAGCTLLVGAGQQFDVDAGGVALALGAGISYAGYTVASKQVLDRQPPDAAIAVVFCLGALLLVPVLFFSDMTWLGRPRGLAVALHLGLVATALSYFLFARGLRATPVATAVTLSLSEPLTAALLGVLVLGERLAPLAMLGAGLLLTGLVVLSLGPRPAPGLDQAPAP